MEPESKTVRHKSYEKDKSDDKVIKSGKPTYATPMYKKDSIYSKRTRLSFSTSDRATKRVIAPYVRVMRKDQKALKPEKEEESKEFRLYLEKKPSVLLRNLSAFLSDNVDLASILHETADVLKSVTQAVAVTLYMVDHAVGEIFQSPRNVISERHKVNWKIEPGKTIAAYVAYNKEYVMVDDVLGDTRFPDGVGYKDETIKSVLCVPVVTSDSECYALIELCRDVTQPVFGRENLKIVIVVTGWMGAAISQNQQRLALQKQQELNDYLLDLTKCYFADTVVMEKTISEIVNFAKVTLGAERGSFYIIDKESVELKADAFEEGIDDNDDHTMLHKKNLKIRLNQESGIPGYVARSCEIVNIMDAYVDPRFNKDVDEKTCFITRSILSMPIMGVSGILGVVQIVNKKSSPCFTQADENLLDTFTLYCALILHYSRLSTLHWKVSKRNDCFFNMLKYHMRPCQHDLNSLPDLELGDFPEGFTEFGWYITPELYSTMPQLTVLMMLEVIGDAEVEIRPMMEFILTVQKSYRDNPYHNFEHAFTVCHCMFNMLRRNLDIFNPTEIKALMIASICHDLDHRGFTNNFLLLTADTLVHLYEESYLENHHFLVTMIILGDCKMFGSISEGTFKELSREILELILATDLALYFRSSAKLIQLWHDNSFDWNNVGHRALVKACMMTSADLSGQCKPFNVSKKITDSLYREFYRQGDIEKSMGYCPLSMMDRDKQHMVPEDQLQFISVVVIPCNELIQTLLPNTDGLLSECMKLRDTWRDIIELRGIKCWRQDDSIVPDA